jgi:serine/threonine protein phosphatase PrpC
MEDEFVVVGGGRLSAVFDGHGGGGVSQYLRDRLHVIITEQLQQQEKTQKANYKFRGDLKRFMGFGKKSALSQGEESTEDTDNTDEQQKPKAKYDLSGVGRLPVSAVAAALKDSFDQIDKEILRDDEYEYQGSTAVVTLLHEAKDGTRTLVSANIGDSRGVLSRNGAAIDLTRDHKPNDDKEKARILAMGEKIEWDHYCKVHRVRNLSLSRAIGDRFAKPAVSGEVEIQSFPIYDKKDEFIVLASDGLWDVMSSQDVVTYVHKRLHAPPKDGADITCAEDMASLKYLRRKNMSRFVANEALRRGSGDNISVVIVWLSEDSPQ